MSGFMFTVVLLLLLQSTVTQGDSDVPADIDTSNPAVQQAIVDGHNAVRRGVQPPASNMLEMSWNSEAEANALKWATSCKMGHSTLSKRTISTSSCGENIYMSSAPDAWSAAIESWHSEVNDYIYGSGPVGKKLVGHYTQMVWYRSNAVGCGVAHCPDSPNYKYFYVCQYCPPGNYQFAHPYTEGSSCGQCPSSCNDKLCTNPCPSFNKVGNCDSLKTAYGCDRKIIQQYCPASCLCDGEIV